MPIEFDCPSCKTRIRTPDESAGKNARCPQCASIVPIPGPASSEPAAIPSWPSPSGLPSPFAAMPAPSNPYGEAGTGTAHGHASGSTSSNPYASSMTPTSPAGGYRLPLASRQQFLAQLRIPAIFILIAAVLSLAYWGVVGSISVANVNQGVNRAPNGAQLVGNLVGVAIVVVPVLIVQGLAIIGSISMLRGSSYLWSLTGAVATLLPCSPCCVFGMGFGIWAVVLLCRPEARGAFS